MRWVKTIARECIGLFVDDARYALIILVWLAAAWLLLPRLGLPAAVPPVLLFAGFVLILVDSAARHARKDRP
jgi:hypothetical protein